MKKLTMICMSALLMLAVSCKKDKKDEIENAGSGFRATVESHEGTGKTHLDDKAVKWDSGDAILVKSHNCPDPIGFTTQESGATVNFDADATLPTNFYAPPYTGYYPADKFSGDQLTLPATQQYDEHNTFASGANPMAATSNETMLPFKNICGVLKLQLYSATACQVRSISIISNTGQQLWGTGTVSIDGSGIPSLGELTGGGNSLTLDMGEGGKPMSIIEGQPTNYFFVVPVGTLGTSFTVKVTETNGNIWTKTANASANCIVRSQITAMPKLAVTTKPIKFTVDANGTTVEFAPGNLYYDGSLWKFESNQYDFRTYAGKNSCIAGSVTTNGTPNGHWGLFGWSTPATTYGMSTSSNNSDYSGDFKDWGGLAIGDYAADTWRTLSKAEWSYLLNTSGASTGARTDVNRFAKAMVNNVKGLLIFPDGYNGTTAISGIPGIATVNGTTVSYPSGSIDTKTWESMESAGVVFLPAAGYRTGASVSTVGSNGGYWSSSFSGSSGAYYLDFGSGNVTPSMYDSRFRGFSVRLVSDVPNASGDGSLNDFGGGNW